MSTWPWYEHAETFGSVSASRKVATSTLEPEVWSPGDPERRAPTRLPNPRCPRCQLTEGITATLRTDQAVYFLCAGCFKSWAVRKSGDAADD